MEKEVLVNPLKGKEGNDVSGPVYSVFYYASNKTHLPLIAPDHHSTSPPYMESSCSKYS